MASVAVLGLGLTGVRLKIKRLPVSISPASKEGSTSEQGDPYSNLLDEWFQFRTPPPYSCYRMRTAWASGRAQQVAASLFWPFHRNMTFESVASLGPPVPVGFANW
jgi:hypothetical protein